MSSEQLIFDEVSLGFNLPGIRPDQACAGLQLQQFVQATDDIRVYLDGLSTPPRRAPAANWGQLELGIELATPSETVPEDKPKAIEGETEMISINLADIPGGDSIPDFCNLCQTPVGVMSSNGFSRINSPGCLSTGSCELSYAELHPDAYKNKDGTVKLGTFACRGADGECKALCESTYTGVAIVNDRPCRVAVARLEYYARGRTMLDNMPLTSPETFERFDGERGPGEIVDDVDVGGDQESALSDVVEPKYHAQPRPCRSMRKAVPPQGLRPEFGARRTRAIGICVKPLSEMRSNIGWQP